MPWTNVKTRRKKRREANRRIRREKRARALHALGGMCRGCGREHNLEFDHVDSRTKTVPISSIWLWKWERILPEIEKCQLLCLDCHGLKDGRLSRNKWGEMVRQGKTSIPDHRYDEPIPEPLPGWVTEEF